MSDELLKKIEQLDLSGVNKKLKSKKYFWSKSKQDA